MRTQIIKSRDFLPVVQHTEAVAARKAKLPRFVQNKLEQWIDPITGEICEKQKPGACYAVGVDVTRRSFLIVCCRKIFALTVYLFTLTCIKLDAFSDSCSYALFLLPKNIREREEMMKSAPDQEKILPEELCLKRQVALWLNRINMDAQIQKNNPKGQTTKDCYSMQSFDGDSGLVVITPTNGVSAAEGGNFELICGPHILNHLFHDGTPEARRLAQQENKKVQDWYSYQPDQSCIKLVQLSQFFPPETTFNLICPVGENPNDQHRENPNDQHIRLLQTLKEMSSRNTWPTGYCVIRLKDSIREGS